MQISATWQATHLWLSVWLLFKAFKGANFLLTHPVCVSNDIVSRCVSCRQAFHQPQDLCGVTTYKNKEKGWITLKNNSQFPCLLVRKAFVLWFLPFAQASTDGTSPLSMSRPNPQTVSIASTPSMQAHIQKVAHTHMTKMQRQQASEEEQYGSLFQETLQGDLPLFTPI